MLSAVHNILRVLLNATEDDIAHGLAWYPEARRVCRALARKHGVTERYAAKVVAALSPRTRWSDNIARADAFLGDSDRRWMASHNRNLEHCLADRPLSGPKVRAFYRCIIGDSESVCVDVWATRVAQCEAPTTEARYNRAADAYTAAAALTPYSARDLQAITWVAFRGSHS